MISVFREIPNIYDFLRIIFNMRLIHTTKCRRNKIFLFENRKKRENPVTSGNKNVDESENEL